MFYGPL